MCRQTDIDFYLTSWSVRLSLCFCGEYNDTTHTTYTLETPNLEYPTLPNEGTSFLETCLP